MKDDNTGIDNKSGFRTKKKKSISGVHGKKGNSEIDRKRGET